MTGLCQLKQMDFFSSETHAKPYNKCYKISSYKKINYAYAGGSKRMSELFNLKMPLSNLPISCFIYEPVYQDEQLTDFRIIYTNEAFKREWEIIGNNHASVGSLLRKDCNVDEYSLQMMERFIHGQPYSFVTHNPDLNLYLHLEPMNNLSSPYGGFFVTNITDYESREQNNILVRELLLDKILVRQFDMVAFIQKDSYGVTIGDKSRITQGSIFPKTRYGLYSQYIARQVVPVLSGTAESRTAMEQSLSLPVIKQKVAKHEPYIVNIKIEIDGKEYHKQFNFYEGDASKEFYIVLKSDMTDLYRDNRNEGNSDFLIKNRVLKEVYITGDVSVPDGVTQIEESAFRWHDYIRRVSLPDTITKIDDFAFSECKDLAYIDLPKKLKSIGIRAFAGCRNLSDLVIPDSVIFIGTEAFKLCDNITIHCSSGSCAERYAIESGIPYIIDPEH